MAITSKTILHLKDGKTVHGVEEGEGFYHSRNDRINSIWKELQDYPFYTIQTGEDTYFTARSELVESFSITFFKEA